MLTKLKKISIHNYSKSTLIAFFISLIFAVLFSLFSIIQYYSIGDSAYDLGLNAQELYSFIHTGSFYTPLLNENPFVEHFTLLKFLQIPVYFLFPSPISLLVFEDIFIALAGFIVYLISMHVLSNYLKNKNYLKVISILLLISYEFSPFSESLVYFPFHNMAFLPFFFLLALYSFYTEKRILHLVSLAFIVSIHSNFVYVVAIILLYELLFLKFSNGIKIEHWLSKKHVALSKYNALYFFIFLIVLYGYLLFAGYMKLYISGAPSLSLVPSTGESGVAYSSPVSLLFLLFRDPSKLFSILSVNGFEKEFFINTVFDSIIYIPALSPLSLIMTLPYMIYALPSSYGSYYQMGYQYSAMVVGPLYIAGIMGTASIIRLAVYINNKRKNSHPFKPHFDPKKLEKNTVKGIAIAIVASLIIIMPYGLFLPVNVENSFHPGDYDSTISSIYSQHINTTVPYLIRESNSMKSNAFILTQNNIMPYFSNHLNVYAAPYTPYYYQNISIYQYIVIQNNSLWSESNGNHSLQNIVNQQLSNGNFTIVSQYNDIEVLENKSFISK